MSKMWFETPLGQARLTEIEAEADAAAAQRQVAEASAKKQREQQAWARMGRRMYAAAKNNRLTSDWRGDDTSADAELVSSLRNLRGRSRQLCRDASYAKRAKRLVVNNVIGWSGIGMQAQIKTNDGKLIKRINDEIEEAWDEWCQADHCHIGGRLHFATFERALMAQVFEAGEVFVRLHYVAVGQSRIPLTLELIEAERLADDFAQHGPSQPGNHIRMGVEVDKYYRPQAYWIRERHPGEVRWPIGSSHRYERVPAADIIHLALVERWPQTRGEPWLHSAARRLNDMDGYAEAEIVKARKQANESGWIETPEEAESFGELQEDGSVEEESEPGVYKRLNPGEEVKQPSPTAPNSAFGDFMRALLREVSAGAGPSYEAISRDYSQSNYSSSRMGILDDRDEYRFIQWFFIRDFRLLLHKKWLQQAMLARVLTTISLEQYAAQPRKFESVRYKPRGWTWVDPTTEVEAYIKAIEAGLTTNTDVVAQTAGGQDIEDVLTTREQELEMMREKGLVFTTSPEHYDKEKEKPAAAPTLGDNANNENKPNDQLGKKCLDKLTSLEGGLDGLSSQVGRIGGTVQGMSSGLPHAIAATSETIAERISGTERRVRADVADVKSATDSSVRVISRVSDSVTLSHKVLLDSRREGADGIAGAIAELQRSLTQILSRLDERSPADVIDRSGVETLPARGSAGSSPSSRVPPEKPPEEPMQSGSADATAVAASK